MRRILVALLLAASAIAPVAAGTKRGSAPHGSVRSEARSAPRAAARSSRPRSAGSYARSTSSQCTAWATRRQWPNQARSLCPARSSTSTRAPRQDRQPAPVPGYVVTTLLSATTTRPAKSGLSHYCVEASCADELTNTQWQTVAYRNAKDCIESTPVAASSNRSSLLAGSRNCIHSRGAEGSRASGARRRYLAN